MYKEISRISKGKLNYKNTIKLSQLMNLSYKFKEINKFIDDFRIGCSGGRVFNEIPVKLKITPELMRLVGYFVSEGHYNKGKSNYNVVFTNFDKGIGLITSAEARIFYGDNLESDIKKPEIAKKVSAGEIKIIIGTHALLQKTVQFRDLSFVVIDEQHRFGVRQRAELIHGAKLLPHFISMSATPIPRTLSLTILGDLDLSIID